MGYWDSFSDVDLSSDYGIYKIQWLDDDEQCHAVLTDTGISQD